MEENREVEALLRKAEEIKLTIEEARRQLEEALEDITEALEEEEEWEGAEDPEDKPDGIIICLQRKKEERESRQ